MTGEPSPKRQRTDDAATPDLEKLQAALEQVGKVDEEIHEHDLEMMREIRRVESATGAKKQPLLEKRGKLLRDVPKFWKQVLSNDPMAGAAMDDEDDKVLDYLESLDVKYVDELGGFKIELTFKENPFMSSNTLWRQVTYDEKSEPEVKASEIEWKDTEEGKKAKEDATFFAWFVSDDANDDLAEHIKDDIWKNPVQYYLNDASECGDDCCCSHQDEDEEGEEDGESDEDDNEEEDEEADADKEEEK